MACFHGMSDASSFRKRWPGHGTKVAEADCSPGRGRRYRINSRSLFALENRANCIDIDRSLRAEWGRGASLSQP